MIIEPTPISGAYAIRLEPKNDARGFFARTWCREELNRLGLPNAISQCNISFNRERGTLRGMHYQIAPHSESKFVRCTQGSIYDVIVDLRPESPTYRLWHAVELSGVNRSQLFIPKGCAHGFQTLTSDTEVFYMMTAAYHPESARGVRWNDPAFAIEWPIADPILSKRDRSFADFS
jgi:dTDP-4-dehydrorhamnose 3,5-epimerase